MDNNPLSIKHIPQISHNIKWTKSFWKLWANHRRCNYLKLFILFLFHVIDMFISGLPNTSLNHFLWWHSVPFMNLILVSGKGKCHRSLNLVNRLVSFLSYIRNHVTICAMTYYRTHGRTWRPLRKLLVESV